MSNSEESTLIPEDRPVTQAEIASAMAVDAVPDETRTHGHADETDQTVTSAGEVAEVKGDRLSGNRSLADHEPPPRAAS